MTKIDIISGFLGAGKTTLIKKLLAEAFGGEKLVLIENEFGEIGIDGGFLKDSGVQVTEMNSGCICCSLVGDFGKALAEVLEKFTPDRIVIEPSGVGKLSDVIKAVEGVDSADIKLNSFTVVVDAKKSKMYMKNFGEFFNNQVEYAGTIILSRTKDMKQEKLEECVKLLREHNKTATIITTPWEEINGAQILAAMEKDNTLEKAMLEEHEHECCHHHDHDGEHHHDHGEDCTCGCHDHDHDGEHHHHEDEEHHHDHGEDCTCGCHDHDHDGEHHHHEDEEHHHDHGEDCTCGCHDHDHDGEHHHHHHHADEVFASWGVETPHKFTREELNTALSELSESDRHGMILRAKGIVPASEGGWLHFDMTPGEYEIREGAADVTGRICVIGSKLKKEEIAALFLA
ncbi:MAG: GTP-binding protein [Lachnospiraceae bacterium]|jgi:G3E family GTPase|nr:GTP-binding protein [Lachnospiraceae bacterium]